MKLPCNPMEDGGGWRHPIGPRAGNSRNVGDKVYADGSVDTSFNGVGWNSVDYSVGQTEFGKEVAIQSDGKIFVAEDDASNRPVAAGEALNNGFIDSWLLRIDPRDGEIATTMYDSSDLSADVFPVDLKDAKEKMPERPTRH